MKYKEWTGDLEGALPDIGLVSKGRVLLIDTEGKEAALELHKASVRTLSKEEGEKRYLIQQKAESRAEEAEKSAEPEAAPEVAATEPSLEPAITDASPAKPSPKGGRS